MKPEYKDPPYTLDERAGIHAALVAAKPLLWNGKGRETEQFICLALVMTRMSPVSRPLPGATAAERLVMRRLGGRVTVYGYLRDTLKVPREQLSQRNVQTFRHLWLDALIKEFA